MPTDTALADALRSAFAGTELATLHGLLVDALDDDAPTADPLGRLCDALHTAAYAQTTHQPA
ncbi:hypothetical protein ACIBCR_16490 [Micromonospora echinospora]|uniref:hypothetical protein n=1 Tax=Micromonospora echinospora TaxID=1877 RepID=UPI00379ED580